MTLSKALKKYTQTWDMLSNIAVLPQQMSVKFNVLYLGDIEGDFFPVIIKDSNAGLGWLYGDAHAIIYKRGGNPLGIDLSELKSFAEEKFSAKQFLAMGMMPEENKLQKDEGGKVVGFLSVNDVISISTIL